jgi:uncharacterized coiled-coil protein SlyX
MQPDGTVGIPWYQFFNFLATRASFITPLNQDTVQLQQDVGNLQQEVTTIQNEVAALQGQVAALQGQVATLQTQVATLQTQVATLQGQVTHLLTKTNDAGADTGTNQTISTSPVMAGIGFPFTPTTNHRYLFTLRTNTQMSTGGGVATIQIYFGSGSPPASGSPITGTPVTSISTIAINEFTDVSFTGLLTGITPGNPYWLDIAVQTISAGNIQLFNNQATIFGLIDPN